MPNLLANMCFTLRARCFRSFKEPPKVLHAFFKETVCCKESLSLISLATANETERGNCPLTSFSFSQLRVGHQIYWGLVV